MVKILLDCDPGLDDALAILLAHGDPNIELVAVTCVGGNVALANTTRNALQLGEYLGFENIPIAAGAGEPLVRAAEHASHVHGTEGMGSVSLPDPSTAAADIHAVDLIIETLRSQPGTVHLVATGPLTNIALALQKEPAIVEWAASFVIMGGSFTRGNTTPAAEFNIYADPEAAAVTFAAGWDVVMVGLDLTLQAIATPEVVDRMRLLGRLGDELVVPLSTFWNDDKNPEWNGQAVHDVVAVAYVTHPEFFSSRPAHVEVETAGEFTSGMTVVDFRADSHNATVPTRLDVDAFWEYVFESYARIQLP
ncbi:nucleoside hydrolase [Glaciihabitans tibetensis]|nr:nucleoside hydrolase [Glaciihabitans tibetensis]